MKTKIITIILALAVLPGCALFKSDVDCALVKTMKKAADQMLPQYREYAQSESLESVKQVRLDAANEFEAALNDLYKASCGEEDE